MKKVDFNDVDKWVNLSTLPLSKSLENFQQRYYDEFRHRYYRFFYHMIKEMKPYIAVEIGVNHGHGLVHMAAGNSETVAVGIDHRDCIDSCYKQFTNCQVYCVDSLESEEIIKNITNKYGRIGVVFQDSSHHYNASHKEFKIYSK